MTLAAIVVLALKASIFLTVLGVGLRAGPGDAVSLLRAPGRLARALVALLVVAPLVAVFVAREFALHESVKVALVALALSPVAPFWPKKSLKAGVGDAYAIGLLVAVTVLSVVLVPLALEVLSRTFGFAPRGSAPVIARTALITVLFPLLIGIAIGRIEPAIAAYIARPLAMFATLVLAVSALALVVKAWPAMMTLVGDGTILALVAFSLAALIAGHVLGGPSREERVGLALACTARHPAIAIAVGHVIAPDDKLVPAAVLLYLLVSAVAVAPYMAWSKRRRPHPSPRPGIAPIGQRTR